MPAIIVFYFQLNLKIYRVWLCFLIIKPCFFKFMLFGHLVWQKFNLLCSKSTSNHRDNNMFFFVLDVEFLPSGDSYKPVLFYNDFWNMKRDYYPINDTTKWVLIEIYSSNGTVVGIIIVLNLLQNTSFELNLPTFIAV